MVVQLFKNSDYYKVSKQSVSRRPTKDIVNVKIFISRHIRGANVQDEVRPRQQKNCLVASRQGSCLEDYITAFICCVFLVQLKLIL